MPNIVTNRVAVIGLAFRFPRTTRERYWSDLLKGCNLITEIDPQRWAVDAYLHPDQKHPGTAYTKAAGSIGDVAGFDAEFFGISPREAALMDPQQRVLLELCWEAIESAGIPPAALRGSDCGVYVGIASTDYAYRMSEDLDVVDASMATGNAPSIAANRLSYVYDLHGPSIAMDTACSSSMVAFHQACRAIASGECGQAIAGGINLHLHPYGFVGFSKATMLSRRGQCSVFDAQADGYVRSEGGGLFLLKDYDQALADGNPILAVVAGSAVNTDGRKSGLTVPCADAQIALMRQAYAQAGIAPIEIDYLEAHGTGTPVGDPIETHAIGVALGQPRGAGKPLPIGSVKSNMGHLETASGVAGLVKAIYALRHRVVPATIGVQSINQNIKPDEWNIEVVTDNRPLRAAGRLVIGVNSFGFGGANAHVILESPPEAAAPGAYAAEAHATEVHTANVQAANADASADAGSAPGAALPLVVTGQTTAAVQAFAARLADALHEQSPRVLYDAAYQLARRRQWHAQRAVVFAASGIQASTQLRALADGKTPEHALAAGSAVPGTAGPVFVYSGNGAQWIGMGRRLLDDPVFAQTVAEIDDVFQALAGYSLVDELLGKNGENRYAYTEIAQPALFAVQVGITRMLARHGVTPAAVMGHSVGEVAAAWASRALSLPDAVQVIFHRSRLQGLTKGSGQMSAVGLGGADTQALLEALALTQTLSVAGVNSASGATVAGAPDALDVLEAHLAARQRFFRRLPLDYAFHSPAMDSIADGIQQALAGIAPQSCNVPFYSTVTGAVLDGKQLDGAYWWRNIRMPVQFADANAAAIADGYGVFVEIGPHAVLRAYLNDALKCAERQGLVVTTASRDGDEPERIAAAAGQVMVSGACINWDAVFPQPGQHLELPAYAWQRERHWHPVSPESQGLLTRVVVHPLLGYALRQHESTWQHQLDTQSHPELADHVVGDAVVFPGAGYAELALAAALQWQVGDGKTPYVELEDLDIRAPLLLARAPAKLVRTVLDRSDARLRILAKEQGADVDWTLHATGRILSAAGPALLDSPQLAVPTAAPDFTDADHAALTRAVGLHYGPAFCAIAHGWRESSDRVLVALAVDVGLTRTLSPTHLHPALLDGAFQLIVHLLKDDPAMGQGVAFVPVRIGRLVLHVGQGQPRYARVHLRRRAPRSLTADVVFYDAQGKPIAVVQAARFRGVRLRKTADDPLEFLGFVATPRPLATLVPHAVMDGAQLRQEIVRLAAETTADASHVRFSQEVEPLLESLCDRYAVDALAALASRVSPDDDVLQAEALSVLTAGVPGIRALLQHVVHRAVAVGAAQPVENGWKLLRVDDHENASAADIWNTLLREYPDEVPAVHAAGRIGMHLPDLLQGRMAPLEASQGGCLPAVTSAAMHRLAYGAAMMQRLTDIVASAVSAAQANLSAGQRLAVLEAGGDQPLFATVCTDTLNRDLADYSYATPDAAVAEAVQQQFTEARRHARAHAMAETTEGETAQRVDLVLVHGAFDTLDAAQQTLAYAAARLKPGGVLLWLGRTPAPWVDFLFGARAQWWVQDKGQGVSAQQPPEYWQTHLQTHGLACDAVLPLGVQEGAGAGSGAYVLLASVPCAATAAPVASAARTSAVAPRGIWLLGNAEGASAELAQALQRYLTEAGHRCQVDLDVAADHLDAALQAARASLDGVHDIVHLDGWGMAHAQMTAEALTQAQVRRCTLAAALAQVCARTQAGATLWLLTTGATQHMRAAAGHAHAAPRQGAMALSAVNDAALWGYGRTLANEADAANCRVRMVDLPVGDALDPRLLGALAREFSHGDAEDEVLLDAAGARYAPRMRALARPLARCPSHAGHPQNVSAAREPGSLDGEHARCARAPVARSAGAVRTCADLSERRVRLGFAFPGQLRNLRWEAVAAPAPADHELEVRIHATGLNFRDVMYALGLLSDEAVENGFVGPTLGLEFSGIVTRVGSHVTQLQPGDAVVGFGPASFSNGTLTQEATVARMPRGISFEAAATIPSVFFTVYYALHHLARLEAGEKILIHGAAGGVGIAAIQYAQSCGADIYATAGSAEKRDFLRLMGVRHIYDSRALAYADEILADTDGRGVDVVLNSLAGEAIHRNFRVLRPFGRFLELGKRDFYENTHIGLRPFRNNISYFGIDADQLMHERPELTRRLFGELMALFAQGVLHPLPYTVFDANDVVHAFRHMQQANQIGKIVVTYRNGIRQVHDAALRQTHPLARAAEGGQACATALPQLRLSADASYLVTGGLGGFGLRTAQWLAEKGARNLILISRSGPADEQARACIAELQTNGVHVHATACDVTDRAALMNLFEATAAMPPLKGIIHAAAVIEDGLAVNATEAQIARNFAAKVLGARHLHELTRTMALDFCVYYSSATTLFGNPGQSAYIAANTWLESLAWLRRAEGLPATCVCWGAIDDVGFLARNTRVKQALQDRMGGAALPAAVALHVLEDMLLADANGLGVLELDWRALKRFLPSMDAPKFSDVARHVDDDGHEHGDADNIAHLLATLDDPALHAHVVELLKAELGEILRVPAHKIDAARSIYDMGLDSLMGVELVVALENRLGIRLPVMTLNEHATVDKLAQQLVKLLRDDHAQQPADDVTAAVAQIAASHAAEVSDAAISAFVEDMQRGDAADPQRMIH